MTHPGEKSAKDLARGANDEPAVVPLVASIIKLTPGDLGAIILLILLGLLPVGFVWHFLTRQAFNVQQFALLIVFSLFFFCTIETFAIILLSGFQRMALPPGLLKWLGAATIGEVAGILIMVLKFILHP